ncbi:DUF3630 family protein [Marinospirillum sp.]|uniref:DUF3630 family protein n=1 Tax=Marinospirillum sp. TaxID=2183934 RepID=UPI0028705CA1|nr:DUF3630 family protein [Marinospirillum sp.]MDR9469322.1 DUF3630 family protein [Marinospirillum sp.]
MAFYIFKEGFPRLNKMASGSLSVELADNISYDDFDRFASSIVSHLRGIVLEKNDSIVMCLWDVLIDGFKCRIVFDDYPQGVFIELFDECSGLDFLELIKNIESGFVLL